MHSIARYMRHALLSKPTTRLAVLALGTLIVSLIGSGIACGAPTDTVYDFPITFYQGQDVVGADKSKLSEFKGTPVVLNFWAGLCPPCRAEIPEFQRFADEYAGRVFVIGADLGQFFSLGSQEDAINLLNELAVSYPAGYTHDGDVLRELGVTGLPATFFINADGSLHRKWQGVLTAEKLQEITDEMLAQ